MCEAKDHWELMFDSNFMRWFHLNGWPALMKIKSCVRQELTMQGGIKNKRPVITFENVNSKITDLKPLVMNKTNMGAIARILDSNKPNEWKGKEVVLYPTTTEMYDKTLKKMVTRDCIRIRAKADAKLESKPTETKKG